MLRSLAYLVFLAAVVSCSSKGSGTQMQAARALELRRDQEAYQLLSEMVLPTLADTTASDSAGPHEARGCALFARACFRTMRTTKGVQAAARAVALDPKDPEARLVRALLDQRRFRNVAAVASAEEAVRIAPREPRYQLALGELSLGGGMVGTPDFARAEASLREALRLQPQDRRARFLLGKTLVLSGKHTEGEALLDSLLSEGGSAEAHTLRGLARMRRREFSGAEEDFRRANVLDPSSSVAWFNGSIVLERLGKSAEAAAARQEFEEAQKLENELHQMEVAYHSNSENLDAGIELAGLLRRAGRTRPAIVLLETLALDRPDDARASIFLSEIAAGEGLLDRAEETARRALEIEPDHPRALVALSNALATENAPEALELARRAVERSPRAAPAHLALGNRLLDAGDAAAALEEFQIARQILPHDAGLLGKAGVALAGTRAWEQAEPLLSEALDREGPNAEWLLHRGLVREGMNDPARAVEDFQSAIEADPGQVRAYSELARALRTMNRNTEADSIEQAGAKIAKVEEEQRELRALFWEDPSNEKRARHLARLLEEEGRSDEAARVLAMVFDPGHEP